MNETVSINLKYFAMIRDITGKKEESLQFNKDKSAMDVLIKLTEIYNKKLYQFLFDENGEPRENITFLINGYAIEREKLKEKKLKDGDIFVILPPIGGG
ncbi:MAG: MoaD/ThiS family protein [Nitrososphaerales archaeon]